MNPCCLARGWAWERLVVPVRDDHRALVTAHEAGILRYLSGEVRSRFKQDPERLRRSFVAEVIVAEVLKGEWGLGDPSRPDVMLPDPPWPTRKSPTGPADVRYSTTAYLSVFPADQDRGHLDRPFVAVTGIDPMVVRGFAYGYVVVERGIDRPQGWRPGRMLPLDDVCALPIHPPA